MRASSALLVASAFTALVVGVLGACDGRCCRSGVDCVDGAVCSEGNCILRCIDDDGCADGATCVDGHCDPGLPGDDACAWGTTPVTPGAEGEPSR